MTIFTQNAKCQQPKFKTDVENLGFLVISITLSGKYSTLQIPIFVVVYCTSLIAQRAYFQPSQNIIEKSPVYRFFSSLLDVKKVVSNLEPEGQGLGIITEVTLLLLL